MNQKWEGLGELRGSYVPPSIGSIAPSRPLVAKKKKWGATSRSRNKLTRGPYCLWDFDRICSEKLVDEMGIYMEAHEEKLRRGEGITDRAFDTRDLRPSDIALEME